MKLFKRFAVFIITLLISIFVLDYFFLSTGTSLPSYYMDDPFMGSDYQPNAEIFVLNEGFYLGKINEGGQLGKFHTLEKPSDCFRIALLGDSFTEGFQVFEKYHFSSIMQENIQIDKLNIEVLNFGRSGYSFELMYIYYMKKVLEYNPDLTLFFLSKSNFAKNLSNIYPALKLQSDSLIIDYSFKNNEEYKNKLSHSSYRGIASFSILQNAKEKIKRGKTIEILLGKIYKNFIQEELHTNKVDTNSMDINYNRAILQKIIDDLNRTSKVKRTKNIIVLYEKFPSEILETFEQNTINVLDLKKILKENIEKELSPVYWSATNKYGHWNHIGHKLIGEYLSKEITNLYREPFHISSNDYLVK